MKTEKSGFLPTARRKEIITKEVDGELLIYDRARDKAHCLNPLAGAIWQHCDGLSTAREIAKSLTRKSDSAVDERVVWLGLEELRRSHLLEEASDKKQWPQILAGMSRREAIRRIGLGAAITLPIVVSMTAPTAVEAAVSCGAKCHPCMTSSQCCGTCFPAGTVPNCGNGGGSRCGPPP
jgi:hypothetical protein